MEPGSGGLADSLSRLGEDLLLLSFRPRDGVLMTVSRIDYGLMGSELIRLAVMGRISVDERQITVLNQIPAGDEELDAALASMAGGKQQRPRTWVARPRKGIRDAYLDRLVRVGALRSDSTGARGRRHWTVPQSRRADEARDRLDAIAYSTGSVDLAKAAFGGLAHAIDLDRHLYPRRADRKVRVRLSEIGRGQWTQSAIGAVESAANAANAASHAAARAASEAAMRAATDAAMQAAVQASMAAAIAAANSTTGTP